MVYTLREMLRLSDYRKFAARYRDGRIAEFSGMGPGGMILGWWAGTDDVLAFTADERVWTHLVTYL